MGNIRPGDSDVFRMRLVTVLFQSAFWIPLGATTYLALTAVLPEHPIFELSDVILHGAAFSYLTAALVLAQQREDVPSRARIYLVTFVFMTAYGVFLELAQSQIPERTADLGDLFVDALGIGVGLGVAAVSAEPVHAFALRWSRRI